MLTYCKEDSPEKALGLWTKIQEEEDVALTDQFLSTLAVFLEEKGVEIPFIVPTSAQKNEKATTAANKSKSESNVDANGSKVEKSRNLDNKALERMVKEGRLDAATKHITTLLEANLHPRPKIFRFYFNKIANTGNYEIIEQLSPLVTPELKKLISFDNRLGHAYLMAGKSEEYLDNIIQTFNDAATKDELYQLEEKFPKGTMFEILKKHPELTERCKYSTKVNVLTI